MSDIVFISKLSQETPSTRVVLLTDYIRKLLVDFLELDAMDDISDNQDFASLGTSSTEAVGFKLKLEKELGCSLKTTLLFDYPSLDLLVDYLLKEVLQNGNTGIVPTESFVGLAEKKSISVPNDIAIVALEGFFPEAKNANELWKRIASNQLADFQTSTNSSGFQYGKLDEVVEVTHLDAIGISKSEYTGLSRKQQLIYKLISDAVAASGISNKDLSNGKTGVFIGAEHTLDNLGSSNGKPSFQVPLANEISFQLNLKGPSETINSYCTSVYVAIHKGVLSIQSGECQQAMVGGINLIFDTAFETACIHGLYDGLLSRDNRTRSFCTGANGYVRSEGAGMLFLKSLSEAEKDGNTVLAIIKGTSVYHGGRGFSLEAPNVQAIKETIRLSVEKAGIDTGTLDYVEAHGIGNQLSDAMELSAINDAYSQLNSIPNKKWHIGSIKPTIGHSELASGMASLIKVVKAFEHTMIPGISGLDSVNSELSLNHSLILRANATEWPMSEIPRRAALNSYAIGGVNAHIILEEYVGKEAHRKKDTIPVQQVERSEEKKLTVNLSNESKYILSILFDAVFGVHLEDIDPSMSAVQYGFDSIKLVQLVRRINQQLGVDIKLGQVLGLENFESFFELIAKEIERSPNHFSKNDPFKLEIENEYPISEVQKGLWYINETKPNSSSFNVPLLFKINEKVNKSWLHEAFVLMLEQHPILKASFVQNEAKSEIVQSIRNASEVNFNLSEIYIEQDESLKEVLFSLLRQPFDLKRDNLFRLYVIETSSKDHYVYFIIHHLVIDGISGVLFMHDFWSKYHQLSTGKIPITHPLDTAFFDFVQWERDYLSSLHAASDLAWWMQELTGLAPTIHLPYDSPNYGQGNGLGVGDDKIVLAGRELNALKATAKLLNVNLSVLFLSLLKVLLYRLTQDEDISVTTPVQGRPKQIHEDSIGCYINLIVTRSSVTPEKTFDTLVKEVKQHFTGGMEHSYYPFSTFTADLGLALTKSKEMPFPVSFTYQNIFDGWIENEGVLKGITPVYSIYQETEDHYTLEVYDLRDSLEIHLKYQRSLFEPSTIQRHLNYFLRLANEVIDSPGKKIQEYELLSKEEQELLLHTFNDTHKKVPINTSVLDLIHAQVKMHPERTALVYQGNEMTYREMDEKSQALGILLQKEGVKINTLVGVCLERSLDMIVSVLGILKAGGAYMPIDPAYSNERIQYIVADAKLPLVLTQSWLEPKLKNLNVHIIPVDLPFNKKIDGEVLERIVYAPSNLAYVIYTSGSTGKPKGVMIPHGALTNLSLHMVTQYGIRKEDRILQFASLSFDMSVEEIFPYLIAGAGIVIREEEDIEANKFYDVVINKKVTVLNIPPLFYQVINELSTEKINNLFSQIRVLAFGGEALPDHIRLSAQQHDIQIFNAYGPTEFTVNATIADITKQTVKTIGKPIANTKAFVLTPDLQIAPLGVVGELYLAGEGLAKGYLNHPELTNLRFVPNPFGEGLIYKTGDAVRWLPDGNLQYLGRLDNQVKIRGYRVELEEIENVLNSYDHIQNSVVVAQSTTNGNILAAFYTSNELLDNNVLRNFLLKELPDYMVPTVFARLDDLPLTNNGKINRKLLESKKVEFVITDHYEAPENSLEDKMVSIWEEVLGISRIGIRDNFFDLGGHSLLAIQIVLRINQELGIGLSLNTFFKAADIKTLVANLGLETNPQTMEDTLSQFSESSEELTI